MSALNLFVFGDAIRASDDSTFTCPDLFSLARIFFSKKTLQYIYINRLPGGQPYCGVSVARGDRATVKIEPCIIKFGHTRGRLLFVPGL